MKKIVFMGTPLFAVPILKSIFSKGYNIPLVYTQPPSKSNRGHKVSKSPIHKFCEENDLKVRAPENFKNLDDLSKNNNLEIVNVSALNQITPIVSQAGFEPKVIGSAFGLEVGQVSQLIEGETGVYMIKLNNLKSAEEIETYSAFENQLTNKLRTNLDFNVVQSLKKSADVVDNRSDYY